MNFLLPLEYTVIKVTFIGSDTAHNKEAKVKLIDKF